MASATWSTQQLAEFVAAVSAAESEADAALAAVERAAEALDADAAAIVAGGEVVAAVGYPLGAAPVAELEAVKPGAADGVLEVPGVGLCAATAVALEHPPGAALVIARADADGLSRDEAGLLRGMARVASLTIRVQRVLDRERAAREDIEELAGAQAALRRVATLVARGESSQAVFAAVAEEVGRVVSGADVALVGRYDHEGTLEFMGGWSAEGDPTFVGTRVRLGGTNVSTLVFERNEPTRVDYSPEDANPASALAREWARSSAGAPIDVEGRLWGVMVVGSLDVDGLPPGIEHELAGFTELVATAIANSQAREELGALADWQAALRRVATRVAHGEAPEAVFEAIATELGRLFSVDATGVIRYGPDDVVTSVGSWTGTGQPAIPGERSILGGQNVTTLVYETGRPTRVAYTADDASAATAVARRFAMRSAVGAPINVGGGLWGALQVASLREDALPASTEERLEAFADLAATAIANAQAREELRTLADEQAALRRVATLVAEAAPREAVFTAVAEEVGRLLSADRAYVGRYEADDTMTHLASWSATGESLPVGNRAPGGAGTVSGLVRETGRPARVDRYARDMAAAALEHGIASAVAAPITVEGRPWGVLGVASTGEEPPPAETETRLARFTELVATAVANAQNRAELEASRAETQRAADEQAALRRVATLVAEGASPPVVFAAVAEEVGRLLSLDRAFVSRFEGDTAMSVAGWSATGETVPVGRRTPAGADSVAGLVRETGRPARIDGYEGEMAVWAREFGIRSTVGAPITVGGHLWGFVLVASTSEDPPPPGTEERLAEFTELVGTAIANAQAREELRAIADEQAAQRRVATLIARGETPEAVFDAVTEEVHRLLHADETGLSRYDSDGLWTVLAVRGATTDLIPVGFRLDPGAAMPGVAELLDGRSARVDASPDDTAVDDVIRGERLQAWVAAPIVLMGRTWGQIAVFSREGPLAEGTEERLAAFTELAATAIANAQAQADLAVSRARIVATADETRHRIERDLHDGAQQRLVTLALKLRAAQAAVPPDLDELAVELSSVAADLTTVLEELREFARGIHPAILSEAGLVPALRSLARRCAVPVELDTRVAERPPETVEVAAYYVISEALANVTKHAEASACFVDVTAVDDVLRIGVRDDGVGGANLARGSGLVGLKDRVEALGGRITVESPRGKGTSIQAELPLDGAAVAG